MNDQEFKMGNILSPMMAMVMLVLVMGVVQFLPKPKGQLSVTNLELS